MDRVEKRKIRWEKQKNIWEKQKAKGKTRLVLSWVVRYIIVSIVMATFQLLVLDQFTSRRVIETIFVYLFYFILWSLMGLFLGNSAWKNNMRKFG